MSKRFIKGQPYLNTEVGTKLFNAPEILSKGDFDERIDIWGVGCMLCLLMSQKIPANGFDSKDSMVNLALK